VTVTLVGLFPIGTFAVTVFVVASTTVTVPSLTLAV
jgi:hypothetical protein